MENIVFDGQQTGERILAEFKAHPYTLAFSIGKIVLILIFFYLVLFSIATLVPQATAQVRFWSTIFLLVSICVSIAWILISFSNSITYLTDRRIVRFERLSPVYTAKRALFWTEALKAKAYQTYLFWRLLRIGTIQVEPQMATGESVKVTDVYMYEDMANYIDKIIYTIKNSPQDITLVKPFVAKDKGKRF